MDTRPWEIRKTPIALGAAISALVAYSIMSLNAAIFPSVADQLLASFFQLSESARVENVFHPTVETYAFGASLLTGGTYFFTYLSLALAQSFANVGHRRALHIVPQH
ncbi:MAG TPA: hypothetical protein VMV18_06730 [bacterium]|nr:hypothetical protein [bacterium]